jgi:hypothetical protein
MRSRGPRRGPCSFKASGPPRASGLKGFRPQGLPALKGFRPSRLPALKGFRPSRASGPQALPGGGTARLAASKLPVQGARPGSGRSPAALVRLTDDFVREPDARTRNRARLLGQLAGIALAEHAAHDLNRTRTTHSSSTPCTAPHRATPCRRTPGIAEARRSVGLPRRQSSGPGSSATRRGRR